MLRKSLHDDNCATNMSAIARDLGIQPQVYMHRRGGGCSFFVNGDLAARVITEVELELCLRTVIACVDDDGLKKLGQHSVLSPTLARWTASLRRRSCAKRMVVWARAPSKMAIARMNGA